MKRITTLAMMIGISVSVVAQSLKVTGKVSDDMGPVAGATVKVKDRKSVV